MLDINFIRENTDAVRKSLEARRMEVDIDAMLAMDSERRERLQELDGLRHTRNVVSQQIGKMKKEGTDASGPMAEMKQVSQRIRALDEKLGETQGRLDALVRQLPNMPHESVPAGAGPEDNVEIRSWGEKAEFSFEPIPHWDIAESLGLIDFARGAKLSGAGFMLYTGAGARLERALINFMLDLHTREHGYREVLPPLVVRAACMEGTGQLPRLEEDMYACRDDDLFLIPTAEVPVTNIHREEVLGKEDLPIYYVAYTACFRREAGSYGKDTRGLMRVHQFDKVELVKFVEPAVSYEELETLVRDAESVLQLLGLHYRVIALCTADLGVAAAKCYDLELWAPGLGRHLEVSSCSNCADFQARRAGIRYRPGPRAKPEYVHTLNGSGVALPRLMASLLETYQQADGTVIIPEPLRPYMGGQDRLVRE